MKFTEFIAIKNYLSDYTLSAEEAVAEYISDHPSEFDGATREACLEGSGIEIRVDRGDYLYYAYMWVGNFLKPLDIPSSLLGEHLPDSGMLLLLKHTANQYTEYLNSHILELIRAEDPNISPSFVRSFLAYHEDDDTDLYLRLEYRSQSDDLETVVFEAVPRVDDQHPSAPPLWAEVPASLFETPWIAVYPAILDIVEAY